MTTVPAPSPVLIAELQRLTRSELSTRARAAHVLLALAASALTVVVISLWLTEPELPPRTALAFGVLACIGAGWVAFSLWVLTSKRMMLARHRVVAGRLAVIFTGVFASGCVTLAFGSAVPAARPAAALGGLLLCVALVLWQRAKTTQSKLILRRDALERELHARAR